MLFWLLACADCPPLAETWATTDTDATEVHLSWVQESIDRFARWSDREGVCVPEVRLTELDDDWLVYQGRDEPILIERFLVQMNSAQTYTTRGLCQALDREEDLSSQAPALTEWSWYGDVSISYRSAFAEAPSGTSAGSASKATAEPRWSFVDGCGRGPRDVGLAAEMAAQCDKTWVDDPAFWEWADRSLWKGASFPPWDEGDVTVTKGSPWHLPEEIDGSSSYIQRIWQDQLIQVRERRGRDPGYDIDRYDIWTGENLGRVPLDVPACEGDTALCWPPIFEAPDGLRVVAQDGSRMWFVDPTTGQEARTITHCLDYFGGRLWGDAMVLVDEDSLEVSACDLSTGDITALSPLPFRYGWLHERESSNQYQGLVVRSLGELLVAWYPESGVAVLQADGSWVWWELPPAWRVWDLKLLGERHAVLSHLFMGTTDSVFVPSVFDLETGESRSPEDLCTASQPAFMDTCYLFDGHGPSACYSWNQDGPGWTVTGWDFAL